MCSSDREEIAVAFKALATALDTVAELDFTALTTPERFALLRHCEHLRRRLPAVEHPLINQIARVATPIEIGGRLSGRLADELRITRGAANRRIHDAADLGSRHTLQGAPLAPLRPATAAAQRDGAINTDHVAVIAKFFRMLPDGIGVTEREQAEAELAGYARQFRPDQLAKLAAKKFDCLVPDGLFSDATRAKRRSLILGDQDADGMSAIKGHLDPEARAGLEAVFNKLAAPGMANPDDEVPCVGGTPSREAIEGDTRSVGQRQHDALKALCRATVASGNLGQHNGLPVTIIVSTTLAELQAGTGKALTGGGSWLPMSDVIRMASHAHHYLRVFTESKRGTQELALFHTRRIASPAQRIVLHARDRGCTHPGCPMPGYLCEAHHIYDYAQNPQTDVHDLTWRCGAHHRLIGPDGWTTRRRHDGVIETIPPAHLDRGQPRVNNFHHPERTIRDVDDGSGETADDP
ncbi:HNH endonuclease [Mycobacterium koreense]|uniref:DUF222 domain-containing protein n=1 Tax=Mycolicibacillus koreensis TaxID=1069220 RepID=A0A7I7SIR8_9MYCO|nr:HNH endonuclease signature motif containing protein [Mycolicibacillus koreensis]MCV7247154.1 HNH endonuclease [Mycolicibacillus koreensis]OSC29854.1 hypothetical protein B8W67_17165 [Mycolicibacillus koreensis]BBY55895.1 hypothetical protein MKOR_31460 [Mycolicibacillus koreensis]